MFRIGLILLIYFSVLPAQNILESYDRSFYSNSLEKIKHYQMFVPDSGVIANLDCLPLLVFLHGAGENYKGYGFLYDIADSLVRTNKTKPLIIVKPDGNVGRFTGSFFTNSELYGNYEDYIVYDLLEEVAKTYNICKNPHYRAIMGHSMGAYGAMKIALKHPDKFGVVISHSGPLDLNQMTVLGKEVVRENHGNPIQLTAGPFTLLTYSMAGAFSPNVDRKKGMPVMLPIKRDGMIIDSVFVLWLQHNPINFVNSDKKTPSIYFDCGNEDKMGMKQFNDSFAQLLWNKKVSFEYENYEGGHSDQLKERFAKALLFADAKFKEEENQLLELSQLVKVEF